MIDNKQKGNCRQMIKLTYNEIKCATSDILGFNDMSDTMYALEKL